MKPDKFISYILSTLTILLCCISCSNESEIELYLQKGSLQQIPVNDATISCTVNQSDELLIFGGVGKYDVFSSNEKIVSPQAAGNSLHITPKEVGKVLVTVMDDAHNAQQVTIFVEPAMRKYQICDISYEIDGGNPEVQEAVKSELTASEMLYKAFLNFEFTESESGYVNLILNSTQEEILVEHIPFVWETTMRQIHVSLPNNSLMLYVEMEPSTCKGDEIVEGIWENDVTEKFQIIYPEIRSVKKILHYRLCE